MVASIVLASAAGLLDALGHAGYAHAATRGSMGVAAALVAIFPAVTILLAATVLRERITLGQFVGFGFGAGGILLISV
jgi:drug/metabolite transporter (DMT)-like permease